MKFRDQRAEKLIKEELSSIIGRELEFDGALVTITEVEVDNKLRTAKVMVSILPAGKTKEAMTKLSKAQGFLQHLLFKKMNIKPMPRINFELDRGQENAADVEKILLEEDN